jgi:peptide/nickel transport system substrate-binding protein
VTFPVPYTYVSNPEDDPGFQTGGEFVEIFEAQFPKITPYLYSDVYGRRLVDGPVCEGLGRYDPDTLEWRGLLAEAWQYDPEGMWVRAKIHDDARFSDGVPVTAEDFRYTFHDLVFNQQIEAARFRSILNVIDRIEVIDEKVVEFHFVEPKFTNLTQALTMFVVPAHFYSQFQPSQLNQATGLLMGSGPYRLEVIDPDDQWSQGEDVVLVRNENYWRDVKPYFDRRRYTVVANNVARLTAYTNGEGDMMRATNEQYRNKTREPEFLEKNYANAWINMRSGFGFIAWNCGERNGELTPFHDKRVRRAMTHLIDRERVLRDFAEGLGQIATGPFPPVSRQSNPNITPHAFDIAKAEALLEEAGWIDRDGDGIRENEAGEPFEWEYTISNSSTFSDKVAQYLKDQCARVGIRCTIRKIDWAIFATTLDRRDFDAITMQWSNSSPESDPYQLWHSESIPNQGDNFTQWNNPEADRLIELGRITLDDDERMAVWHQLHEVFHDEQPYTFMLNSPWIRFISKDVGNVNPYSIGLDINEMYQAP